VPPKEAADRLEIVGIRRNHASESSRAAGRDFRTILRPASRLIGETTGATTSPAAPPSRRPSPAGRVSFAGRTKITLMTNTLPSSLVESLRGIVAEGRLHELDLLNPADELECAIADTLAELPEGWPLATGDIGS